MKIERFACDNCGRETEKEDAFLLSLPIARRADPDGSMGTIDGEVDLCHSCVCKLANLLLRQLSNNNRNLELIKTWSGKHGYRRM